MREQIWKSANLSATELLSPNRDLIRVPSTLVVALARQTITEVVLIVTQEAAWVTAEEMEGMEEI